MRNVLVIYYSQSGQLLDVLESLLESLSKQDDITVSYEAIRTKQPYPFPWSLVSFFDVMPESVLEIPTDIERPEFNQHQDYDLVILAYQPWFLSTSIPVSSFLQSEYANVLKNRPVITVTGSRNMWLMAHDKIKAHLRRLGANLVMHIPFVDRAANAVSVITIPAWMLTGKRKFFPFLPKAGVSDSDIEKASLDGEKILHYLNSDDCKVQKNMSKCFPAEVNPRLIACEKAGRRVFSVWAKLIRVIGKPKAWLRKPFLLLFMIYLVAVIMVIFPLTYLTYKLKCLLAPKAIKKEVDYYSSGE